MSEKKIEKGMRLVITGRLPGMNEIIGINRWNRYAGAQKKRDVQKQIAFELMSQTKGKRYEGKVNMVVDFYEPNMKRDEDNVKSGMKFILDAMQDIGLIKSDSRKYVHSVERVMTDRDDPRIEITIQSDADSRIDVTMVER